MQNFPFCRAISYPKPKKFPSRLLCTKTLFVTILITILLHAGKTSHAHKIATSKEDSLFQKTLNSTQIQSAYVFYCANLQGNPLIIILPDTFILAKQPNIPATPEASHQLSNTTSEIRPGHTEYERLGKLGLLGVLLIIILKWVHKIFTKLSHRNQGKKWIRQWVTVIDKLHDAVQNSTAVQEELKVVVTNKLREARAMLKENNSPDIVKAKALLEEAKKCIEAAITSYHCWELSEVIEESLFG